MRASRIRGLITDINRFDYILAVLFEEGFHELVYNLGLHRRVPVHVRLKRRMSRKSMADTKPVRLRRVLQRLGPTFIKLGQLLSVRPDILPKEYMDELSKLQEHNEPVETGIIMSLLKKELGHEGYSRLHSIQKNPVAVGSLAQVHEARLKSGETVALKVRKPRVKEMVSADIDILFFLAHIMERHSEEYARFRPVNTVKEFASWTLRELDFRQEAANIRRFRKNFSPGQVRIPEVYDDMVTEGVIVMSFEEIIHITDYRFKSEGQKKKLAQSIVDLVAKMVFEDGFFHADPHPGNVFVTAKGKPLLLDFGMVGELSEETRGKMANLFERVVEHDSQGAIASLKELTICEGPHDESVFEREAVSILTNWYDQPIEKVSFVKTIYKVIGIGARYGYFFNPNIILLTKALIDVEGMGFMLYPKVSIEKSLKPYMKRFVVKKYSPSRIAANKLKYLEAKKEFFLELPEHLVALLEKLEKGDIEVHASSQDIAREEKNYIVTSRQKVLGFVFAAFLISYAISIDSTATILSVRVTAIFLTGALISLLMLAASMRARPRYVQMQGP